MEPQSIYKNLDSSVLIWVIIKTTVSQDCSRTSDIMKPEYANQYLSLTNLNENDNHLPAIIFVEMFLVKEVGQSLIEYDNFMSRLRFSLSISGNYLLFFSEHSEQVTSSWVSFTPFEISGTTESLSLIIYF